MYLHGYICECGERCGERIRLTPTHYRELAAIGNVVSPYCAHGRVVLLRDEDVVVVRSHLVERSP